MCEQEDEHRNEKVGLLRRQDIFVATIRRESRRRKPLTALVFLSF
jgi:hypothetical protein